ncbi:MAG: NUDIX hydrolase [Halobacteriales archaeon]|nr:NUDIX hydrolase [Halobacteriales archaeon]
MDTNHDWKVVESKVEYETGWYEGGYDEVEQPDGSTKKYYWARLPPAVIVVARYGDEVVFVEQYRPTVREKHVELVAGIVEEDDGGEGVGYEEAGVRELREETGFVAEEATLLQEYRVATGVLRHDRGVVYADVVDETERSLDENEFLSVRRVPVEDALDVARRLPANDATLGGLLFAREDGYI